MLGRAKPINRTHEHMSLVHAEHLPSCTVIMHTGPCVQTHTHALCYTNKAQVLYPPHAHSSKHSTQICPGAQSLQPPEPSTTAHRQGCQLFGSCLPLLRSFLGAAAGGAAGSQGSASPGQSLGGGCQAGRQGRLPLPHARGEQIQPHRHLHVLCQPHKQRNHWCCEGNAVRFAVVEDMPLPAVSISKAAPCCCYLKGLCGQSTSDASDT